MLTMKQTPKPTRKGVRGMEIVVEAGALVGMAGNLRKASAALLFGNPPVKLFGQQDQWLRLIDDIAESLEILAGTRSK